MRIEVMVAGWRRIGGVLVGIEGGTSHVDSVVDQHRGENNFAKRSIGLIAKLCS